MPDTTKDTETEPILIPCKSTSWLGADIIIEPSEDRPGYILLEIDDMPQRGRVYLSPDERRHLIAALQGFD